MKVLDTGKASAERNMSIDLELLQSLESVREPILHLYDWEAPSVTYGHFTNPAEMLDVAGAAEKGYHLAKRPTGGGVIFHTSDYAFSVLIPSCHPGFSQNTLDNYHLINAQVAQVLQDYSGGSLNPTFEPCPSNQSRPTFCMARPTCYDLVIQGKKAAGAAQRKTKHGFLHQGSISLVFPFEIEELINPAVSQQMKESSFFLLEGASEIQKARSQLHKIITSVFSDFSTRTCRP